MNLLLKVIPGASRDSIQWLDDSCTVLKVRVTAAPEKGKANKAVIAAIASQLGLPKSAVTIAKGTTSQQKRVVIIGLSEKEIRDKLSFFER